MSARARERGGNGAHQSLCAFRAKRGSAQGARRSAAPKGREGGPTNPQSRVFRLHSIYAISPHENTAHFPVYSQHFRWCGVWHFLQWTMETLTPSWQTGHSPTDFNAWSASPSEPFARARESRSKVFAHRSLNSSASSYSFTLRRCSTESFQSAFGSSPAARKRSSRRCATAAAGPAGSSSAAILSSAAAISSRSGGGAGGPAGKSYSHSGHHFASS